MAPQYGHTSSGVNMANYRLLAEASKHKGDGKAYRTPYDWQQETKNHVGMGSAEQKLSTSLRQSSNLLQNAAAEQVVADVMTVEDALKAKISHTESLKVALESTLTDVLNEIEMCVTLKAGLEDRLKKVQTKLDLNSSRLQVRDQRPSREKTMDDVEGMLLRQKGLMVTMIDKVKRAIGHVDKEISHLDSVRAKLEADLRDKIEAIEVDSAVLRIPAEGGSAEASMLRKKHDCLVKTPHTWVRSTEENIGNARHWLTDSQRLRKAVRAAIYNARMAEHEQARSLNSNMMAKLNTTHHLKEDLEKQLARVKEEYAKAESQRQSLAAALEAKKGPLAQAKDRFNTRKARPCREQVQDDVEAALTREIAHLNAVTSQLNTKVSAVDREMAQLDLAAAMIEDNIRDKEHALALDERAVLLDGRINLTTPPPSSVASYPSNAMSTVRTATLRRIQDLEGELMSARREREALEANILSIKQTMGSPSGPLSPGAARGFSPKH